MRILFNEFNFTRPRPANFCENDSNLFDLREQTAWQVYYKEFQDVKVNHELFVKYRFKILSISFGDTWQYKKYNNYLYLFKNGIKNLTRKNRRINELVWVLDQFSTGGYYHWITEILPRLWMANEVVKLPLNIPTYFPEYFFQKWSFGHELLKPFKRDYFKFKPLRLLKVSHMHFISQPGGPLAFQPKPLAGSTKVLKDYYFNNKYSTQIEKIYISRNKGNKRIILNEDEILPLLQKRGYKIIYNEALTIEDQVNLFSRAKKIVSIHGAGLTNMVFMEGNSDILEIRNSLPDHMNNCFLALADTIGLKYHYFLGNTEKKENELRPIDYSIKVDRMRFEKCLEFLNM